MKILNFILVFVIGLASGIALSYFLFQFSSSLSPAPSPSTTPIQSSSSPEIYPQTSTETAPILMYHHIRIPPKKTNKIESGLDVSPLNFEEQMAYLYAKGYKTISLDKLFEKSEEKKFIITFDDGYKDVIENAYPLLKRLDYKSTIFLIVNDIGKEGYLNWEDIKILEKAGWSFGSHTLSHRNLLSLKQDEAEKEIVLSKEKLEGKLENPVDFFCYPAGKFNQDIIKLVKEAGYKGAVTTLFGKDNKKEDIYQLKRIRVSGSDTLQSFIKKLGKGL